MPLHNLDKVPKKLCHFYYQHRPCRISFPSNRVVREDCVTFENSLHSRACGCAALLVRMELSTMERVLESLGIRGLLIAIALVLWGYWYVQGKAARQVGQRHEIEQQEGLAG